jgi:hypothetical protein
MRAAKRISILLLAIGLVALLASSVYATKLQHRNLEQMTKLSGRIFVGTCTAAVEEEEPLGSVTIPLTRYTFQVEEMIKGELEDVEDVRQLGKMEGPGSVVGMPMYKEGAKYLLFLLPDSQIGLTSPVGLFQGSFQVLEDPQTGQQQAMNSYQNVGLFQGMEGATGVLGLSAEDQELMSNTKGAIDYDRFLGLVKKMAH